MAVSYTHLDVYKRQAALDATELDAAPPQAARLSTRARASSMDVSFFMRGSLCPHKMCIRDSLYQRELFVFGVGAAVGENGTALQVGNDCRVDAGKLSIIHKEPGLSLIHI